MSTNSMTYTFQKLEIPEIIFNFKLYFLAIFLSFWFSSFMLVFHATHSTPQAETQCVTTASKQVSLLSTPFPGIEREYKTDNAPQLKNKYVWFLHNTTLKILKRVSFKIMCEKYCYVWIPQ